MLAGVCRPSKHLCSSPPLVIDFEQLAERLLHLLQLDRLEIRAPPRCNQDGFEHRVGVPDKLDEVLTTRPVSRFKPVLHRALVRTGDAADDFAGGRRRASFLLQGMGDELRESVHPTPLKLEIVFLFWTEVFSPFLEKTFTGSVITPLA